MTAFCTDRDLLLLEPSLYTSGAFAGQVLAAGDDGVLNGTGFHSPSASFLAAGVRATMVLCVRAQQVGAVACYEIASVDNAANLVVSTPRVSPQDAVQGDMSGEDLGWQVVTFAPQIFAASTELAERLRLAGEAAGIDPTAFADSVQLAAATARLVAANVLAAAAEAGDDSDGRWGKATLHRRLFHDQLLRLRLAVDADGDGRAERTRSLANVRLLRR